MTPEHKIGNNEEAINQTEKGFQAEQVAINIKTLETLNMNLMRKLSQLPEGAQEILEIKAEIARNNASIDSVRNIENAKDKRYEVGLEESFSNPLYWGGKNK